MMYQALLRAHEARGTVAQTPGGGKYASSWAARIWVGLDGQWVTTTYRGSLTSNPGTSVRYWVGDDEASCDDFVELRDRITASESSTTAWNSGLESPGETESVLEVETRIMQAK